MWLQSVLQANCCWEASLLLWIKHYYQCIKKALLHSALTTIIISNYYKRTAIGPMLCEESLFHTWRRFKLCIVMRPRRSCRLKWISAKEQSFNKATRSNDKVEICLEDMTFQLMTHHISESSTKRYTHTQTNTRRFKAHEYEYVEPKMRRTLWADPWGADYAEGENFLIQIKCHVLCGVKKNHFYKCSSASTTVELKKETESMFSLKYFACAITVTMVTVPLMTCQVEFIQSS